MKNIGMNFSQHKKFFNKYLICKKKEEKIISYSLFHFWLSESQNIAQLLKWMRVKLDSSVWKRERFSSVSQIY